MSTTKTIAKNSGWYGLESAISAIVGLFTSIAIARTLGPDKMSYIIYAQWVAGVAGSLGGIGIPATTSKYMAEFIGMGDRGTARYIYFRTLLLQICMATVTTAGIMVWILRDANADNKLAASLIVLSIWPCMVNFISAQANAATEDLSANLPASITSIFTYFLAIAATVIFHWGVIGVGASYLFMRMVDFLIRLFPTMKRVLSWETTHAHPEGLGKRMMSFAWQSVATMIIALVVWSRSEVALLHHFCKDPRQVSFYSVAFSMADRLLIAAGVFGSATATTMFVQVGRDRSRLSIIAASAFRYLALVTIPLHSIATALAAPALMLLYGAKYADAFMVVTLAPLLCMPKAFLGPAQSILQCTERQSMVIAATITAGVIDLSVAYFLIHTQGSGILGGAVGACIGSGCGQIIAIGTMWAVAIYLYKIHLPWVQVVKISFISFVAAMTAHFIALRFASLWAILLGGSAALVILITLVYAMRVLEPQDRDRMKILTGMLPRRIARPAEKILTSLIRPKLVSVTP
jgi:O-antigen/teichoic acid export membrane protein